MIGLGSDAYISKLVHRHCQLPNSKIANIDFKYVGNLNNL